MSKRSKGRDSTMGFGLNLFGTKEDNPFELRRKPSAPKPEPLPKLPEGGPGTMMADESTPVRLPANYYPPEGAESIDLRRLLNIAPGTVEQLLFSFEAQTAQAVVWYKYGIFTDALDASLVQFFPRINGKRILRYHGDPQNNYALNLSLGPNLNDSNLITTQIFMKPGDVLTWHVTNNDAVVNPMGVRMVGYVDLSLKRKTMSFGG